MLAKWCNNARGRHGQRHHEQLQMRFMTDGWFIPCLFYDITSHTPHPRYFSPTGEDFPIGSSQESKWPDIFIMAITSQFPGLFMPVDK